MVELAGLFFDGLSIHLDKNKVSQSKKTATFKISSKEEKICVWIVQKFPRIMILFVHHARTGITLLVVHIKYNNTTQCYKCASKLYICTNTSAKMS